MINYRFHNAHSKLLREQEKKQIEKEWEAKPNWDDVGMIIMTNAREDPDILKKKSEELEKSGNQIDELLIKVESISSLILASKLSDKDKQTFVELTKNMYYRRDELWEESSEYLKKFYVLKRKIAKNL